MKILTINLNKMKNIKMKIILMSLLVAILPFITFAGGSNRLTNAKVTNISGKTITATYAGGVYTINAIKAKITNRSGKKMNITEIYIGDSLNINGKISFNKVTAESIKDMAVRKKSIGKK